jgi:TPR repeat protein
MPALHFPAIPSTILPIIVAFVITTASLSQSKSDGEQFKHDPSYYRSTADLGDPVAQFQYGLCLFNGRGVHLNRPEAAKYFKLSADQGYSEAQYWYAHCLAQGDGVIKNNSLALQYFKRAADKQYPDAQFQLGLANWNGISTPVNRQEAIQLFQLAAAQGHNEAKMMFATCILEDPTNDYNTNLIAIWHLSELADNGQLNAMTLYAIALAEGTIVPQDLVAAANYIKTAADLGDAQAQYNYSLCLRDGRGVIVDLNASMEYLELAADNGFATAQNEYGLFLLNGIGMTKNETRAAEYFQLAADQGIADAQYNYGRYLSKSHPKTSVRYYEFASSQGHAGGQNGLGLALLDGRGVDANRTAAIDLFRLAAAQNHANAMANLATCLEESDAAAADELCEKAAKLGDAEGQLRFGLRLYAQGKAGVAMEWLMESANQGYGPGYVHCAFSLIRGVGCQRDDVMAREYFRMAAELENTGGQHGYGVCLLMGIGGAARKVRGRELIRMAADAGYAYAQYDYAMCLKYGIGVRRTVAQAAEYMEKALNHSLKNYSHFLGMNTLYGSTILNVDANMTAAVKYWRMAAEKGYLEAEYILGSSLIEQNKVVDGCRYVEVAGKGGHDLAQEMVTTKCSDNRGDQ